MKRLFAPFITVSIGLMFSISAVAVDAPSGSYQRHYANRTDNNHWLILGAIERIKGAVSPEDELRIKGKITEWLWQLPVGTGSEQAFNILKGQIEDSSITLFECEGRSCGASNDFANQVFQQSILYGRESSQLYWAGLQKAKTAREGSYVWVLYTTTRSNKRSYAYLEKISLSKGEIDKFDVHLEQSETDQLMKVGYRILEGAEGERGLSEAQINWIQTLLAANQDESFALVVHQAGEQETDGLIEASSKKAQSLLDQMTKSNAFVNNLYVHGAGPMMPREGEPSTRVELVRLTQ